MGLEKYQQRVNSLPPTQHEPASTVQNSSPEPEVIPEVLLYLFDLPELNTTCLECLLVFVVDVTKVAGVGAGGPEIGSSDGI